MGLQIPGHDKLMQAYARRRARVFELLAEGHKQSDVAKILKISRGRVSQIVKANGKPS